MVTGGTRLHVGIGIKAWAIFHLSPLEVQQSSALPFPRNMAISQFTFAAAPRFCTESTDRLFRSCIWETGSLTVPLVEITSVPKLCNRGFNANSPCLELTHWRTNYNDEFWYHTGFIPKFPTAICTRRLISIIDRGASSKYCPLIMPPACGPPSLESISCQQS